MLSLLDVMFDTKMHDIVDQLPVDDTIRAALLGLDSPITDVLRHAIDVEDADLATVPTGTAHRRRPLPSHHLDHPTAHDRWHRLNHRLA